MKRLDLNNWKRREHFLFFKDFDEPFFSLVANVECSFAKIYCKENNLSFFLWYLYLALKVVNQIKEFAYRIQDDMVVVYDKVNASPTINRPNGTFGFSYIEYEEDFELFLKGARKEIERVQNSSQLMPAQNNENVIHFSTIPWISFTGLSHARHFAVKDSIPKISFGKLLTEDKNVLMPVSVTVNHALMDGYHVGQFLEKFAGLLKTFTHNKSDF